MGQAVLEAIQGQIEKSLWGQNRLLVQTAEVNYDLIPRKGTSFKSIKYVMLTNATF